MIFEVEVYMLVGNGNCETIVVDMEGEDEQDVKARMLSTLNSDGAFVAIGTGVFQKENVRGTCVICQRESDDAPFMRRFWGGLCPGQSGAGFE